MSDRIKEAFDMLKAALQADADYAWSWHCNIAMAFIDTEPSYGGRNLHRAANEGAANFMQRCFDVDANRHSGDHYFQWTKSGRKNE